MHFVGREREIRQIKKTLTEGNNVIVLGKYGMGRTSLIKHIAETTEDQWRFVFVDFSQTPGGVCDHLLAELFPMQKFDRMQMRYRSSRFRIATLALHDKRRHVLVLDNVCKLSAQKLDLLRYLTWEKRFQFVAIVESFMPKEDSLRLRVRLYPAEIVTVNHLDKKDVCEFYKNLSERYQLQWAKSYTENLTEVTGGYPLRMKEIALREIARKELYRGDRRHEL